MTEGELRKAIEEKGYTYDEETEPQNGFTIVVAKRDNDKKTIGVKDYILGCSLRSFKQNNAYHQL